MSWRWSRKSVWKGPRPHAIPLTGSVLLCIMLGYEPRFTPRVRVDLRFMSRGHRFESPVRTLHHEHSPHDSARSCLSFILSIAPIRHQISMTSNSISDCFTHVSLHSQPEGMWRHYNLQSIYSKNSVYRSEGTHAIPLTGSVLLCIVLGYEPSALTRTILLIPRQLWVSLLQRSRFVPLTQSELLREKQSCWSPLVTLCRYQNLSECSYIKHWAHNLWCYFEK